MDSTIEACNLSPVSDHETLDVYGDLDELNYNVITETKLENVEDKKKYSDIEGEYNELKQKYEELSIEHDKLKERMSSLILTARAEIQRKNLLISSMREELDNLTFKRGLSFGKNKEKVISNEEIALKSLYQKEFSTLKTERTVSNNNIEDSKTKEENVRKRLGKKITKSDNNNDKNISKNYRDSNVKSEPINVEIKIERKSANTVHHENSNNKEWREVRTVEIKYHKGNDQTKPDKVDSDSNLVDTKSNENGPSLRSDHIDSNSDKNPKLKEIELRLGPKSDNREEAVRNQWIVTDISGDDIKRKNEKDSHTKHLTGKADQTRQELDNIERILEKRSVRLTKNTDLTEHKTEKNADTRNVKLRLGKRNFDGERNGDNKPSKDNKIDDKHSNVQEKLITVPKCDIKRSSSDKTDNKSHDQARSGRYSRNIDRSRKSSRDRNYKLHRSRERQSSKELQNNNRSSKDRNNSTRRSKERHTSKDRHNISKDRQERQNSNKERHTSKDRHNSSRSSRDKQNSTIARHSSKDKQNSSLTRRENDRQNRNSNYRDRIRSKHESKRNSAERQRSSVKETNKTEHSKAHDSADKSNFIENVADNINFEELGEFYTLDEESYEMDSEDAELDVTDTTEEPSAQFVVVMEEQNDEARIRKNLTEWLSEAKQESNEATQDVEKKS